MSKSSPAPRTAGRHRATWPDAIPGTATFSVELVSPAGLKVTEVTDADVAGDGYERTADLFALLTQPGQMLLIKRGPDVG
jgi:hypothetical protein